MCRTWPIFIALLWSCSAFAPITDAERSLVAASAPAGAAWQRTRLVVRIASPGLNGEFDGVMIAGRSGDVRLQLFPEVGGKILDLTATASGVRGRMPQIDLDYDQAFPLHDARPHLFLILAVTLIEHHVPLTEARLTGARRKGSETELRVEPTVQGCELSVVLTRDGTWKRRNFRIGPARWQHTSDGRVVGPRLDIRIETLETEAIDAPPAGVFSEGIETR